jgi:hypothetical protein
VLRQLLPREITSNMQQSRLFHRTKPTTAAVEGKGTLTASLSKQQLGQLKQQLDQQLYNICLVSYNSSLVSYVYNSSLSQLEQQLGQFYSNNSCRGWYSRDASNSRCCMVTLQDLTLQSLCFALYHATTEVALSIIAQRQPSAATVYIKTGAVGSHHKTCCQNIVLISASENKGCGEISFCYL